MRAAFDRFFWAAETKKTDRGVALLSLPRSDDFRPIALDTAEAVVNRFIVTAKERWNLDLRLAPTFEALPDEVQAAVKDTYGEEAKAQGVVHNGVAYVVADEHADAADIEETILHEIKGHVGVHRLYGKDIKQKLNALYLAIGGRKGLTEIANRHGIAKDLSRYAEMLGESRLDDTQRAQVMTDELLAHIAQNPKFTDRVKAIVGAIRQWLRDNGFVKLSEYGETDLLHILRKANEALHTVTDDHGGTVLMVSKRNRADYHAAQIAKYAELDQMLRATYNLVSRYVPEIKHVVYDPTTDRFLDTRTGREYTRERFKLLAGTRGAREADAGTTTLERAALASTVLSKRIDEAEWRALLDGLVSQRDKPANRLKGAFYSRTEPRPRAGLSVSGAGRPLTFAPLGVFFRYGADYPIQDGCRARQTSRIFCACCSAMAGRAANTTPFGGIRPPFLDGNQRPVTPT